MADFDPTTELAWFPGGASATTGQKSGWAKFGEALYSNRGNITDLIGSVGNLFANQNTLSYMANALGIQSSQYGLAADMTSTAMISPNLQRDILDMQAMSSSLDSFDKWLGRYKTTRAGYTGGNIQIDVGTPMAVGGKILESLDKELRTIRVTRSIEEWNKVNMPLYRAESSRINSLYARDMSEIDRTTANKTASINKTAGLLQTGAQVLSLVGGMMK